MDGLSAGGKAGGPAGPIMLCCADAIPGRRSERIMTARRNLKFAGLRHAAAALLAGLALTGMPGVAGSAVADSAISSRVTVQIIRPAGVIGLQELSNAQGFLAAPDAGGADPLTQAASPARRGPVAPPPSGGALAAAIAISGAPNQSFSLTLTDSLVVVTDTGELVVTNFDHNAGNSPTIGGDGAAQIAIGARSQSGSPETLQQLTTNAGGTAPGADGAADPNIVAVTVQTAEGPQVIQIQRPDNFGPTIFGEKFFTVMVSYN